MIRIWIFLGLAVLVLGIVTVARRMWKRASVEQKLEDDTIDMENYNRIKDIDLNEVKKRKEKVKKYKNS